jgi:YidC/Oxa1 family membrane protein insertase
MWDALIVTPFINLLMLIYSGVGNLGVAIILFTVLFRLILHPLTVRQVRSSQAMQKLQQDKRWIEAQKKYKDDRQKLSEEQMKLYRELGINPMAGCLPLLIQFPIIIGLYQAMIQTVANGPLDLLNLTRHLYPPLLSNARLIPLNTTFLWMDVGAAEHLLIPGLAVAIPVLAILVMISTYVQGRVTIPAQTVPGDQSAMMSNMMSLYMPLFMGWIVLTLASGLGLYFLTTNVFGILEYTALGQANWKAVNPFGKKARPAQRLPDKVKAK